MEISVDMLHESSKEDSGNEGWRYRAFFCNNKLPHKSSVQDYSNYTRSMYWTCEQDSGFPNRVNHAVATHRWVHVWLLVYELEREREGGGG